MSTDGWVFNIQRFSLHDGPGIRTTVFLKGCPLRCQWCHNPEGMTARKQVRLTASLCAHCGRCVAACEHGGHEVDAARHELHLDGCVACGRCVDACPPGALEMVGSRMTVEQVMAVVRRDVPFYEQSKGGMTLSGGEPLAQLRYTRELLEAARGEEIATAIETSAYGDWGDLVGLRPLVDHWMVDLKHTDPERHRELTGVSNQTILANIAAMAEAGFEPVVRIPWVPQRNADDGFLRGLLAFLPALSRPPAVELMLYHRLGQGKWVALGGEPVMPDDVPAAGRDDVQPWIDALAGVGVAATAM